MLDEARVIANLAPLLNLRRQTRCKVLYSIKALPLIPLLNLLKDRLDGFSVSSLFEARLARQVLGDAGGVHLTTPGLRPHEFAELTGLCTHISFNSLPQYQNLEGAGHGYSRGLRINPKQSWLEDHRYDPCRPHSKLGVDIRDLTTGVPVDVEGLHVHTVFSFQNFEPLRGIADNLLPFLQDNNRIKWLNLGGGYLFNRIADQGPLAVLIERLQADFGLEIYFEPGKAVVGDAGYLVATVLDRFESDGKPVLILDTSVNHNPEVFEYQSKPRLLEEDDAGRHTAILAGCTCLAGDVFGEYRFRLIPRVNDRLVFANFGAYTLIKSNRFNGYNYPDIYRLGEEGVSLSRCYKFEDYSRHWSGD